MIFKRTLFFAALVFCFAVQAETAAAANGAAAGQSNSTQQTAISPDRAFIMVAGEAEWGNPQAMLRLGGFYENGVGIARNFGKAREWYEKAAEAGMPEAVYRVGVCWETGMGSAVDMRKAVEFYERAAGMGSPSAALKLANLHDRGMFQPRDEAKIAQLLQRAADGGLADAMGALGLAHIDGRGVKKDANKGLGLLSKAAEGGSLASMHELAVIFGEGRGEIKASPAKAVKWYLIALNSGYPQEAIRPALEQLVSGMTEEQAKLGEAEAEAWFKARQEKTQQQ